MKKNLKIVYYLCVVLLLAGIFLVAPVYNKDVNSQNDSVFNELEPFFEAISIIRSEFINKDVKVDQLVQGAIKGMISELDDPYSRYVDPLSFQREQEDFFIGHFDGLGIEITIVNEKLTVISPIEDTPADKAGIKAGDIIVEIDGETTKGITLDEVLNILRGEKGTPVTITIEREDEEEFLEIEIIRDTITVEAVKEELIENDKIGYIRISRFNVNTGPGLKKVLDDYEKLSLEGIIVDLRNNPGGLLESAIEVASEFIKEGDIVRIKSGNNIIRFYESYGNNNPSLPLVVLVNMGSASASEIVAGAIQDLNRGTIIGENTFGKGLVQQVYSLSDDSAVIVSTSEYYTPNGRVINGIGIEPDIIVQIDKDDEEDVQLKTAIDLLLGKDIFKE
ncbi:MAG: S41 family peptidase [Candidatus Caldatribacteriota bacterium]|nr:S41 family peptidase [Atribacterota bacterium]MDD3640280.1 S41 family peptidase [Atribacterota bacterium]MDD4289265.1 S41 family peptidase [Atribacterota bacterium]MDD4764759.1 S41 family peptidase [Atribacterota bacterium]